MLRTDAKIVRTAWTDALRKSPAEDPVTPIRNPEEAVHAFLNARHYAHSDWPQHHGKDVKMDLSRQTIGRMKRVRTSARADKEVGMILAGDIGGTKSVLALVDPDAGVTRPVR